MTTDLISGNAGLRVAIVEHEDCIRETLQWHLEYTGHDVIVAKNINQMRELLSCSSPCPKKDKCVDIYLIHKNMVCGKSAHDFVRDQIKRGCKISPPSIIVMAGDLEEVDRIKAIELGHRVISKPVTFDKIDNVVDQTRRGMASAS